MHREVLAVEKDQPSVDGAVTRHHPIAGNLFLGHAEMIAAMLDKHIEFLEGIRVEQDLDALTRRELAPLMLALDAVCSAADTRQIPLFFQFR